MRCLDEFASREINLTKIESRPRRERMGHYMFFVDLARRAGDAAVAEASPGCERSANTSRARLLPAAAPAGSTAAAPRTTRRPR